MTPGSWQEVNEPSSPVEPDGARIARELDEEFPVENFTEDYRGAVLAERIDALEHAASLPHPAPDAADALLRQWVKQHEGDPADLHTAEECREWQFDDCIITERTRAHLIKREVPHA